MSLEVTYRNLLIEQWITDQLKAGSVPTPQGIEDRLAELDELDLTEPQFVAEDHHVDFKEESSASKFNTTMKAMTNDISILYKEMGSLAQTSITSYERWRLEAEALEKRLISLEDRIENLLLLTQDTEGYHSFIMDNFVDASLIDRDLSTCTLDPVGQLIYIGETDTGSELPETRIFLNNISLKQVSFKLRSTVDFLSRTDVATSDLTAPFKQISNNWWTQIEMKKNRPVTCELVVQLGKESVTINKIFLDLHDSSRSSPMVITPLYSQDNFNFTQLPTNTYTQEARNNATFSFTPISAKFIKFILTKTGPDPSNSDKFTYQFGFKSIEFYNFDGSYNDDQGVLISRPLFIKDSETNEPVPFSKLTLEICERVETGTDIKYYVVASNDEDVAVDDDTVWHPIAPISRADPRHPIILDLGDIDDGEFMNVGISYDAFEDDDDLVNPGTEFHLLSLDGNTILDETIDAIAARYAFTNSNERILNYQIKDSDYDGSGTGTTLSIDENKITLFRNVGEPGLDPLDTATTEVRGVQRGWRFEDPYYVTVVQINNPEGITMDVGDSAIIIDDLRYTNVVPATVLTGKAATTTGIHTIKVYKDSWLAITPDLTTLDDIKAEDSLYPFNHKLIVEGYAYPDNYQGSDEKIYKGVDLFASELMKKVSIFDLVGSVPVDGWKYYALDRDAADTHTDGNEATRVFVIKVDENNPDFQNERFVLRFHQINERFTYLRFKAVMTTEDSSVTPAIDSYKLKFGG